MEQLETEKKRRGRPKKLVTETNETFSMERYQSETIEEFRRTIARQERLIKSLIGQLDKKSLAKQTVGKEI